MQLVSTGTFTEPASTAVGGFAEELAAEARVGAYPASSGFLCLLAALVRAAPPVRLGTGYRAPGLRPYVAFVVREMVDFRRDVVRADGVDDPAGGVLDGVDDVHPRWSESDVDETELLGGDGDPDFLEVSGR